jgi:hypothetical protein
VYSTEWISTSDWLGTPGWRSFKEARAFVRKLGLTTRKEWWTYFMSDKKPDDIPTHPERAYKSDWISIPDWLGK